MYRWIYLDGNGQDVGSSDPFDTAGLAEDWLGREWEPLADRGIEVVELVDESTGQRLYRMSLSGEVG